MNANDDLDVKTTLLDCFYMHIYFVQIPPKPT